MFSTCGEAKLEDGAGPEEGGPPPEEWEPPACSAAAA